MGVKEFVALACNHFGWTDLSGDLVMDVGCGFDGSHTQTFAKLFPNVQKIIAINSNPAVIRKAQLMFPHPKIEYWKVNIENHLMLARWYEIIPKIISLNTFTSLTHVATAFENMYLLLKPGGEAAVLISLHQLYFAYQNKELIEHPRWGQYIPFISTVPENHFEKFEVAYLIPILESIGFSIEVCEEAQEFHVYQSDEDCRNCVTSRLLLDQIPIVYKEEFKQTAFEIFLRNYPKEDPSALPCFKFKAVSLLLKRPLAEFATI